MLILAPILGVGIGLTAAYGVTHRQKRIHFVERDNLQTELENLDIEVSGSEVCVECGDELQPDEVGAIIQEDGEYRAICDQPECLDTYDLN